MIFASLLMAAAFEAPTIEMIERLPPAKAGDLILAGKPHASIETVERAPTLGLEPPGVVEIELVEAPAATAEGCTRGRWTATFRQQPGSARGAAALDDSRRGAEVALRREGSCPSGQYAQLSSRMTPQAAFAALRHLARVRTVDSIAPTCSDATGSGLCASPQAMRAALARIEPWAVTVWGSDTVMWLGMPGQVVTEVSYPSADPTRVTIRRFIPPPA